MTLPEKLEAIKAFMTLRVSNDRELSVSGDDTDTLFSMLDEAIDLHQSQPAS